jgi:hypothetical protein
MPKAVANIVSVSAYHNHSTGDLADQLGAVKTEIEALETREKSLRDELLHRSINRAARHSGKSLAITGLKGGIGLARGCTSQHAVAAARWQPSTSPARCM